jgi:hypothetical protein
MVEIGDYDGVVVVPRSLVDREIDKVIVLYQKLGIPEKVRSADSTVRIGSTVRDLIRFWTGFGIGLRRAARRRSRDQTETSRRVLAAASFRIGAKADRPLW